MEEQMTRMVWELKHIVHNANILWTWSNPKIDSLNDLTHSDH